MKQIRTAEYVSAGHPDKICDQISDAILDEYLKLDPNSRVAIETIGGHGYIHVMGEVTSTGVVDIEAVVRKVYSATGYSDRPEVLHNIVKQSPEIACGVNSGGAGDQGIMIGYACDENEDMLPQELYLARKLLKNLPPAFGPDAKSQVTLNENSEIEEITLSAQIQGGGFAVMQHGDQALRKYVKSYKPKKFYSNVYSSGGFAADTGLTGRKLIVDNYGPRIPIGGGCFSGKDATKVDRSAAYMARYIAVDYLRRLRCHEVLVKLAYSIGVAEPVMAIVTVDGEREINLLEVHEYNLTPNGIIKLLDLRKPKFLQTSRDGHFGNRNSWDK